MTPSAERAKLTAALRDLKQRTGLSLTGLEERTPFSKSSWGRYLKGETLPPREAVQELCRLAGEPAGHCLALWELAESETSGRAAQAPPAPTPERAAPAEEPPRHTAPPPGRVRRGSWRAAGVAAAVLAVSLAGLTATLLLPGDRPSDAPRTPQSATTTPPQPRCRGASCDGKDPMNMLCGTGPRTLATHRAAGGARLELRYSPGCGASWARMWSTEVGDRIDLTSTGPTTRSAEVTDALDARAYVYTPMTRTKPGTVVRACFRPAQDPRRECFEATIR